MTREEARNTINVLINSGVLEMGIEERLIEIADHICKDDWEPCIGTPYCEYCSHKKV